ncbi:hypothetical protein Rsub_07103 [Raphidocelis subcapitata]|uniref:Uncharacterized protein n=1 Tax=Raphidocelis subcapitata TaxID=307507 RepID=A0A2V0P2N7_9CHLO|nr:hypothetical protein Rsub_07103 [Raphidocelis subcapitata]|eukprot:GBF94116.1 hypothetical protein Rsub_07103 [Raphidocelis subcapitata]
MLRTYPVLERLPAAALKSKAAALGTALRADRREVGAVLCRSPRALGASMEVLSERLGALHAALVAADPVLACCSEAGSAGGVTGGDLAGGGWGSDIVINGATGASRDALRALLLRLPWLLTLSPRELEARLGRLEAALGVPREQVVGAIRRHPPLLQSANALAAKLSTLGELMGCTAGDGTAGDGNIGGKEIQMRPAPAAVDAALRHPELLCFSSRGLRTRFAALQEASGLPTASIAAALREQPQLLVAGGSASAGGGFGSCLHGT